MRTTIRMQVTGKTREDLESKTKQRIAKYLSVDVEEVEGLTDIEMFVGVGEEAPMELTFVAECSVRIK